MRKMKQKMQAKWDAERLPYQVDILRPGGLRTGDPGASARIGSYGHINWEQFELNTGQRGRLLRTQPMPTSDV